MKLRLLGCVIASLLATPAMAVTVATSEQAKRIDTLMAPWTRSDAPGCSVAAIQDGEVVFERGYGMAELEQGVANRPETVFNIASMSKQFTTLSLVLLTEDGKVSLDDDIRKYVPELPDYGGTITLRQLANHTSGLRDYPGLLALSGWNWVDAVSEERILSLIARQKRLNFPIGSEYLYSNTGYFLMMLVVQRVSGQSLGDYADARIFKPLGMLHTRFYDDRTMIMPNRAVGHLRRDDGSVGIWRPTYEIVGDGAVLTTVQDVARWEQQFLAPKLGRDPVRVMADMTRHGVLVDGKQIDYALGISHGTYRGLPTLSHSGGIPGYATNFLRFPAQKLAVTALCNQGGIPAARITQAVADVMLEGRFSEGKAHTVPLSTGRNNDDDDDAPAKPLKFTPAGPLSDYTGVYYSQELDANWRVETIDGVLTATVGYLPGESLKGAEGDTFSTGGNYATSLAFKRDGSRRVSGFILDVGRVRAVEFVRVEAPAR
ncbi:serine hydrolase domain-containing protein [Luteimonas sp. RIT-PG2_3]